MKLSQSTISSPTTKVYVIPKMNLCDSVKGKVSKAAKMREPPVFGDDHGVSMDDVLIDFK